MKHKKTTDVRLTCTASDAAEADKINHSAKKSDSECQAFIKLITDYFAGELAEPKSEELMTHLEACDACRKEFEEFDELWSSAGEALAEDKTPESLSDDRKEFIAKAQVLAAKSKKTTTVTRRIVEYGAVAAILLIISGMLLPALNTARGKARMSAAKSEAKMRQLESLSEEDGFDTDSAAIGVEPNVTVDKNQSMNRALKNYRADNSDRRKGVRSRPAPASKPVLSAAPMESSKQIIAKSNWSTKQVKDSDMTFGDDSNEAKDQSQLLSAGRKYKRKAGASRSISREHVTVLKSEVKKDQLKRRNEAVQTQPGSSSMIVTRDIKTRPIMKKVKMDYAYRGSGSKKTPRFKELNKSIEPQKLEETEMFDAEVAEPKKRLGKQVVAADKLSESKIVIEPAGRAGELREKESGVDKARRRAYAIEQVADTSWKSISPISIPVQRKVFKLNLKLWNVTTTQNLRTLMQQRGYPLTARVSINRHDNTVTFYDTAGNLKKAEELFVKLQASEKALKDYRNGIPMLKTKLRPVSTFSVDTDTASYIQAKQMIMNGQRPDPMKIREEEFINYFDYHYRSPAKGAFGVYLEAAPAPFRPGKVLLRIGVQGKKLGPDSKTASRYTILFDGSGSMAAGNRLELSFKALRLLFKRLKVNDRVSLIVCGEKPVMLFNNRAGGAKTAMLTQVNRIKPSGAADFSTGLRLAYQVASRNYLPGGMNKVIIISDGILKLPKTKLSDVMTAIDDNRRRGISNIVIGVGGDGDDKLLEKLAVAGDGSYVFIDREQDAIELFNQQFDARFREIARDVKIQVEFNAGAVPEYRQVGYSNRQLSKADFRNDKINAGEIGSGQSVTALYEMNVNRELPAKTMLAIVRLRYKAVDSGEVIEEEFAITVNEICESFTLASPGIKLAALVAEFAESLRFPETPGIASGSGIAAKLSPLYYNNFRNDGKVAELLMLTRKVK
jgi:Uncharacterized protein YfbK, C-terminal/von Willebrand factor/von Willebrand factor type A domain/Putative zinc-finger